MPSDKIREAAEADLITFARLVNPHRVYGDVHIQLFKRWMKCERDGEDNTGDLLPRDHQKSHCAAVKAAWVITKDPDRTLLYVSATSGLAEKQLKAIKDILTSETYTRYWPDMVNPEEGKREKWTNTEICVDHPLRKEEGVRDSTVFAAGLTTNITGFHATDVFLDDIVVPNNAYTEEGRESVRRQYSQLASIETTGARETVVGTRYHPKDIYQDLMDMKEAVFNDEGEIIDEVPVYNFSVKQVETDGNFLWPKEFRAKDGKPFGFNNKELARKKAKYLDTAQFYAQYYNDANDPGSNRIGADRFQYYDKKHLIQEDGYWTFKGQRLNVYAAIDFAFSLSKKADYTAIVVIGIAADGHIYVLDIDRFKTDKIKIYFDKIKELHSYWGFKKLRAEVTVAQVMIVRDIKDYIIEAGMRLSVDEHRPTRAQGSKEERINSILEHRYENQSVWHYKGGYIPMLEEEILLARPSHDDVKDAFASAVDIAVPPMKSHSHQENIINIQSHSRFGGVAYRR